MIDLYSAAMHPGMGALPRFLLSSALGALCAACGGESGSVQIFAGSALTEGPVRTIAGLDCAFGEAMRSLGDIDGDGRDDLVLGLSPIEIGGAAGRRRIEVARFPNEGIHDFVGAGDTDGDGRADVLVRGAGGVRIYRRGLPPDADADVELTAVAPGVAPVGDVNRDGFADVAVISSQAQQADIYLGGRTMDSVVDLTLPGTGYLVAPAGDFNADGIDDVLFATQAAPPSSGLALYWGGPVMDAVQDLSLVVPSAVWNPRYAFPAGDLNGDGVSDLVMGWAGDVHVYFGGTQPNGVADLVLSGWAAAAGDLDGDGLADLAVGDRDSNRYFPVRIFRGGPTIDDVADLEITGDGDRFGGALAYLRSFDGGPALAIAALGLCVY